MCFPVYLHVHAKKIYIYKRMHASLLYVYAYVNNYIHLQAQQLFTVMMTMWALLFGYLRLLTLTISPS